MFHIDSSNSFIELELEEIRDFEIDNLAKLQHEFLILEHQKRLIFNGKCMQVQDLGNLWTEAILYMVFLLLWQHSIIIYKRQQLEYQSTLNQ